MTGPQHRHRSTAVVPVSIEGLGDEVVTVTPATALRWYGSQERGQRHGAVQGFDITDCAAQLAAASMLGRRSIWYRRIDAWRFEVGPLSRGRRLAGYQGLVGEPPRRASGCRSAPTRSPSAWPKPAAAPAATAARARPAPTASARSHHGDEV